MIIPVKCFTCGNVLANKYQYYVREVGHTCPLENLTLTNIQYEHACANNNPINMDRKNTADSITIDNVILYK